MDVPDIGYAKSGDVSIAYQAIGEDGPDILFVRGITGDLLSSWDQPLLVRHLVDLAANGRLIVLDKRGTGLSDRVAGVATLETRMDDIRAVMDAAGSERAVLWSGREGDASDHALRGHVSGPHLGTGPQQPAGARVGIAGLPVGTDRERTAGTVGRRSRELGNASALSAAAP